MKRLLGIIFSFALVCSASAETITVTPGSSGGGGGAFTCVAGACTSPNGTFTFNGVDGSPQAQIGSTANSVDILRLLGGISGAGASLVAASGTDANVAINITSKGNANVNFASSGSGQLATALDPGAAVSTGGAVQLTPSTSNGPVKVGNATYGINLDGGTAQVFQTSGQPFFSDFPGYIVSNWYVPYQIYSLSSGTAPGAGSIRLYPAYIKQQMTINTLGVRVTTLSAGGNVQAAIYASNNATGRPTGTPLASTSSMSTASVASVNAAASLQLNPGLYWFATNCDNGTAIFESIGNISPSMAAMFGSATQAADLQGTSGIMGVSVAQTFGTWPTMTGASFTELAATGSLPVVQFKIASVP